MLRNPTLPGTRISTPGAMTTLAGRGLAEKFGGTPGTLITRVRQALDRPAPGVRTNRAGRTS